jgi:hypothetical protein
VHRLLRGGVSPGLLPGLALCLLAVAGAAHDISHGSVAIDITDRLGEAPVNDAAFTLLARDECCVFAAMEKCSILAGAAPGWGPSIRRAGPACGGSGGCPVGCLGGGKQRQLLADAVEEELDGTGHRSGGSGGA